MKVHGETGTWTREDILALSLQRKIPAHLVRKAVDCTRSLEHLFTTAPDFIANKIQDTLFHDNTLAKWRAEAKDHTEKLGEVGADFVTIWDDDYPQLLKSTPFPPAVLFVRGSLQHSESTAIAIVGTRRNTTYGKLTTERFAGDFANSHVIVVSGLANGIDSIAHSATVKARGKTYAVVASGLDSIQPNHSQKLAKEIVDSGGCIISEYPLGIKALPAYFPQRNRIISGIARATVVIESGATGGSLITANFAVDQGRELFAVPGNVSSERSIGCNQLIKRNLAMLALSPQDVLLELGIDHQLRTPSAQQPIFFNAIEQKIYSELSLEPMPLEKIADITSLSVPDLLVQLLTLEFRNLVRQLPGKQFIRM